MRDIGKNIKQLRQMKNMTQDELAEKLFVTRQTISNYETGKSRPDVEMLTQIAETLGTDPNTVLYGLAQQANRERMIRKLGICVAALLVLWIGYTHLATLARELQTWQYDYSLTFVCIAIVRPAFVFVCAWTAMQSLQIFAKLSPLQEPWAKRLRITVVIAVAVYVFLTLPAFSVYIFGFNFLDALPNFIDVAWSYAGVWLQGVFYNMSIKPNTILFGILGCLLWLGIPQKTEK